VRSSVLARSALAVFVLSFAPSPAAAYVRTVTSAGVPTHWKTPCVLMEFSLGAFPAELDAAGYLDAAQQAGSAWNQASLDGVSRCSNVALTVESVPDVGGQVGRDGHNRLIFRQDAWCREPPPTDPKEPKCYDASALAITSVFQLKNSGEILEADMEVNAVTFTWGDFVGHPEQIEVSTHDFQGAITHELGHVLGLDHTCYTPATLADGTLVPRPKDNLGNPVPDCDADNPPAITQATMYVSVNSPSAEVGLRSLSPDDVQGMCDIYPFASDFVCLPPSTPQSDSGGGGCSLPSSGHGGATAGALVLLALAALLRRRR